MIVRNEAHGIRSTLKSIKPFIDRWTILDTGSTDGTQNAVRDELAGIPGELHEGPFGDFASARNRLLDLHGTSTDWALMLDADDIVEGGEHLRVAMAQAQDSDHAMLVKRQIASCWFAPLLFRTSKGWRYHGRVHEYACGPNRELAQKKVNKVTIHHRRPPQSAEAVRARWVRDAELLEEDLARGVDVPRTLFYLAQTYECLGDIGKAEELYRQRSECSGWDQETFEAMLRRGRCLFALHKPNDAIAALLAAHSFMPRRAEPLHDLAEYHRQKDQFGAAYMFAMHAASVPFPSEALFIDSEVYEWKRWDTLAVSAFYLSKKINDKSVFARGMDAAEIALAARPNDARLMRNRAFFG